MLIDFIIRNYVWIMFRELVYTALANYPEFYDIMDWPLNLHTLFWLINLVFMTSSTDHRNGRFWTFVWDWEMTGGEWQYYSKTLKDNIKWMSLFIICISVLDFCWDLILHLAKSLIEFLETIKNGIGYTVGCLLLLRITTKSYLLIIMPVYHCLLIPIYFWSAHIVANVFYTEMRLCKIKK